MFAVSVLHEVWVCADLPLRSFSSSIFFELPFLPSRRLRGWSHCYLPLHLLKVLLRCSFSPSIYNPFASWTPRLIGRLFLLCPYHLHLILLSIVRSSLGVLVLVPIFGRCLLGAAHRFAETLLLRLLLLNSFFLFL